MANDDWGPTSRQQSSDSPPAYTVPPAVYTVPPPAYAVPPAVYTVPPPPLKADMDTTLSKAWSIYSENWRSFVIFFLPAVLISAAISILTFGSVDAGFFTNLSTTDPELIDPTQIMSRLGRLLALSLAGGILSLVAQALFMGGMVGMAKEAMETGNTTPSTGFSTLSNRFMTIIVTYIAFNIVVAVGFILCCIPGIFFCYWWIFALVIVVVETADVSDAFSKSKAFAIRNETFWFAVVLLLIVGLVSGIFSVIGSQIAPRVTEDILVATAVGSIVSSIASLITMPFFVIALTVHYLRDKASSVTPQRMHPNQYPPSQPPPSQPPPSQYPPSQPPPSQPPPSQPPPSQPPPSP